MDKGTLGRLVIEAYGGEHGHAAKTLAAELLVAIGNAAHSGKFAECLQKIGGYVGLNVGDDVSKAVEIVKARFDQYEINEELKYRQVDIDNDRYSGAYSGASYTAWLGTRPNDIDAGDIDCEQFWRKHRNEFHGRGSTPQAALEDLLSKNSERGVDNEAIKVVWSDDGPMLVGSAAFDEWRSMYMANTGE